MSDDIEVIKVKPSHPSQGEFVLINASDFDPERHVRVGDGEAPAPVPAPSAGRRGRPAAS